MVYQVFEIMIFLLLAAVVGLILGWWLSRRDVEDRLVETDQRWRQRLHMVEADNKDLRNQLSRLTKGGSKEGRAALESLMQENRGLRAQIRDLEAALLEAEAFGKSKENHIGELESRLAEMEKHLVNATSSGGQLKRLVAEKQELEERNQQCLSELHALQTRLAECEAEIDGARLAKVRKMSRGEAAPAVDPLLRDRKVAPLSAAKTRRRFLDAPEGRPDDLKKIKGIGPKLEAILHDLGIYHFHQIATFTQEDIEWVNGFLAFPGRIERERWVEQAKRLAELPDVSNSNNKG